jgi:hypothetical protein
VRVHTYWTARPAEQSEISLPNPNKNLGQQSTPKTKDENIILFFRLSLIEMGYSDIDVSNIEEFLKTDDETQAENN